jgi:aminoacrylate peracid reductase
MSYKVVVPKGSAPPLAPYSPGTKAGNAVYVSGTLALDGQGNLIGRDDVRSQTRHILESRLPEGRCRM